MLLQWVCYTGWTGLGPRGLVEGLGHLTSFLEAFNLFFRAFNLFFRQEILLNSSQRGRGAGRLRWRRSGWSRAGWRGSFVGGLHTRGSGLAGLRISFIFCIPCIIPYRGPPQLTTCTSL